MLKFNFSLTTRDGQKVDSIQIFGQDLAEAERKLRQMYRNCEVTQYKIIEAGKKFSQASDIEEVLTLIAKND
jgi:hypothetical protein